LADRQSLLHTGMRETAVMLISDLLTKNCVGQISVDQVTDSQPCQPTIVLTKIVLAKYLVTK
jgi:hypothetical protein